MEFGALGKVYKDTEIIKQGQPGDCMYVIQDGLVEVVYESERGEVLLGTRGKGEFFGEMAIFEQEARSATVRARGEARVLTIDKKNFLRRINEDPSLAFRMVQMMSARLRELSVEVSLLRTRQPLRVVIIGAGHVGATCAYALQLSALVPEIALISLNPDHAHGEAMDLSHGIPFGRPVKIWAGDFSDCSGADIVVLAAGVAQKPGETRLDLLKRNAEVFQEIVPQIVRHNRDAILIVVTNPVDVLTYITWKISNLPASQVIGSGTILDTARFRYLIGQHLSVEPRSVHAHVIGEHGDSQVAVWSLANIAGIKLDDYGYLNGGPIDDRIKEEINARTRKAAYEIIKRKGATSYAIATGLVRIIEAIVRNENSVLTVSSLIQGTYGLSDVALSLPGIVNRKGITHLLKLPLAPEEKTALEKSARIIRSAIESI